MYVSLSPLWDLRGRIEKWQKPASWFFERVKVLMIGQSSASIKKSRKLFTGKSSRWESLRPFQQNLLTFLPAVGNIPSCREGAVRILLLSDKIQPDTPSLFSASLKFNKIQLTRIQTELVICHFLIHGKHVGDVEATHLRYVLVLLCAN